MRKQYRSLLLLGICCLWGSSIQAQQAPANNSVIEKQIATAHEQQLFAGTYTPFTKNANAVRPINAFTVDNATYLQLQQEQTRRIYREHPAALTLTLPRESGGELVLELVQQSPLAPGFFVSTGDNQPVAYNPGVYYRGTVKGMSGSVAAVSVFEDEIIGVATTPDKGNLVLGRLQNKGNLNDYILYSDLDLKEASPFTCGAEMPLGYTEKIREYLSVAAKPTAGKCVRVYLECDYRTYQNKGSVTGATNYVTAIFNNLATLYANESITTAISQVYVWTTQDSYTASSTLSVLNTFRSTRPTFNGDIAHLVSIRSGAMGGIAWVDALCSSYRYAYSQILASYSNVPTYSWSVECMTHEMGHNLGSPHTHNCTAWSGGAIDGCGPAAGYSEGSCSGPIPPASVGGTIMSYCHLTSTGIKFSNGFGTQPGNLIRNRVSAASCLGSSCTGAQTGGTTTKQGGSLLASVNATDASFQVYPNPARDVLHLNWTSDQAAAAIVTFTDLAGRKIAVYQMNSINGKNSFDIPLQKLPAGMYLLQLENGSARFQQKIMIQHP